MKAEKINVLFQKLIKIKSGNLNVLKIEEFLNLDEKILEWFSNIEVNNDDFSNLIQIAIAQGYQNTDEIIRALNIYYENRNNKNRYLIRNILELGNEKFQGRIFEVINLLLASEKITENDMAELMFSEVIRKENILAEAVEILANSDNLQNNNMVLKILTSDFFSDINYKLSAASVVKNSINDAAAYYATTMFFNKEFQEAGLAFEYASLISVSSNSYEVYSLLNHPMAIKYCINQQLANIVKEVEDERSLLIHNLLLHNVFFKTILAVPLTELIVGRNVPENIEFIKKLLENDEVYAEIYPIFINVALYDENDQEIINNILRLAGKETIDFSTLLQPKEYLNKLQRKLNLMSNQDINVQDLSLSLTRIKYGSDKK